MNNRVCVLRKKRAIIVIYCTIFPESVIGDKVTRMIIFGMLRDNFRIMRLESRHPVGSKNSVGSKMKRLFSNFPFLIPLLRIVRLETLLSTRMKAFS